MEGYIKSASSMGTQDFVFSPSLVNYSQPIVSQFFLYKKLNKKNKNCKLILACGFLVVRVNSDLIFSFIVLFQARIPLHYADPYVGGLLAATNGPQALVSNI